MRITGKTRQNVRDGKGSGFREPLEAEPSSEDEELSGKTDVRDLPVTRKRIQVTAIPHVFMVKAAAIKCRAGEDRTSDTT